MLGGFAGVSATGGRIGISALGDDAGLSTDLVSIPGSCIGRSAESGAFGLMDGASLAIPRFVKGFFMSLLRLDDMCRDR